MTQNGSKYKARHQLDLLDEKRAFVVIALTDKLSHAGKLVALNALAHYNSENGYSWASIPVVAKESGYSAASTKSISPGFDEIEQVGAFKVVRNPPRKGGKKSSTHRCCPIMPWFRDEYERFRQAGKIKQNDDPFADIRSDNDNESRQGSQPDQGETKGLQPRQSGFTARSDRANSPIRQGYKPDEGNGHTRTERNAQTQTDEPAGGLNMGEGGGVERSSLQPVSDWPADIVDKFLSYYPKGGDPLKISKALNEIRREGRIDFKDILRGASNYKREKTGTETQYIKSPENFLKGHLWKGYQQDNRPKPRRTVAI